MHILKIMSIMGIETIINAVLLVVLTLTLVVTAYYAHQVSKQTEITRREAKRSYIVELMKYIIAPLIHKLEWEIESIKKREYGWKHQSLCAEKIKKLVEEPEILFSDLRSDFPDLKRKIEDHNDRCQILQEKLKSLDEAIYTLDFKEKCHDRIAEYNKKYPKPNPKFLLTRDIEWSAIKFVNYIIDNSVKLFSGDKFHDFWREYGSEFLQIRDREDIKVKTDEIDLIAEELKRISQELKERLEKLRDKYRREYGIPIGEIDISEVQDQFLDEIENEIRFRRIN